MICYTRSGVGKVYNVTVDECDCSHIRIFAFTNFGFKRYKNINNINIINKKNRTPFKTCKSEYANMRTIEFSAGMSRKTKQGIGSPERGLSKNSQRFNYQGIYFSARLFVPLATPKVLDWRFYSESRVSAVFTAEARDCLLFTFLLLPVLRRVRESFRVTRLL